MLKLRRLLICLAIALAGCSTAPRRTFLPTDLDLASGNPAASGEYEPIPPAPRFAPPPATRPASHPAHARTYADTWIPLIRWARENHSGSVAEISAQPTPAFSLTTSNGVFVFETGSSLAKWNGMELHLGFEPQLIDGQPFVHALDLEKNVEPLIHGLVLPSKPNPVIVIDPGHGGSNTGTRSVLDGRFEKVFTLNLARRLAPLLEREGWRVFLTRTNDTDVSLADRVAFAERCGADLFVSLHFNAPGAGRSPSGVETYCLTPVGMHSSLTRGYDDDPLRAFPNNAFDGQNLEYAARLHRAVLSVNGDLDRGIGRARFLTVIRGQNCPAVLVEGGYLSDPDEARRISDPVYCEKLATALADALALKSAVRFTNAAAPAEVNGTNSVPDSSTSAANHGPSL